MTLTHDPKLDDPALAVALRSECFYIGALGSKRTHQARCGRLKEMGFTEADLARIHGPIGLAIGAVSPAEIAVSILAQMTQVLRRGEKGGTGEVDRHRRSLLAAPPDRAGEYRLIYADPPWTFATYSRKGKGRSAEAHYDCMSLADIKALPVADWAAPDCVLLLWVTDPLLDKAMDVIRAWGFTYKTVGFCWAKLNKSARLLQRARFLYRPRLLDARQPGIVSAGDARPSAAPQPRRAKIDRVAAPRAQPQTRRGLSAHRGVVRGSLSRNLRAGAPPGLGWLGQSKRGFSRWPLSGAALAREPPIRA